MRAFLLLLLAGCSSGPVTAITYNAGLAVGFVDGARERTDGVAEAIAAFDADVVCLEEVWLPDQIAAVEDAAADSFPERVFAEFAPDVREGAACAPGDLDAVLACADSACADSCLDEIAGCLIESCPLALAALPTDCQRCSFAQIGHELDDIVQTCTTSDIRYANEGSYGIGLLSRDRLRDVELLTFESALIRRGVLHAIVDTPAGDADVYCTHFASDLSPLPYTEEGGTWADENEWQAEGLLDWVEETATTGRVLILGDVNSGPDGDGLVAELPQSWADFEGSGYDIPFVDQVAECTLCPDNPLRSDDSNPILIDHILLGGFEGEATAERIGEETFPLETCAGTIDAAWSDHYGVRVTVEP